MNDFNRGIIDEFHANDGKVGGPFAGAPILLLITTGAKSGQLRTHPVVYLPDGDRVLVFASKGGAPTNPDWYHNLVANPKATVEVGTERYDVKATVLEGEDATGSTRVRPSSSPASPSTRRRPPARSPSSPSNAWAEGLSLSPIARRLLLSVAGPGTFRARPRGLVLASNRVTRHATNPSARWPHTEPVRRA